MLRAWYDYHANSLPEDPTEEDLSRRELNLRILADKKPYFMRYIYPTLMKDYNTYEKNSGIKCLREFRVELKELLAMDEEELSERQKEFIRYYHSRMPVGMNDCVMNRICRRFEAEFNGYLKLHASKEDFDYSILKDGESEYTSKQYHAVEQLYVQHKERLQEFLKRSKSGRYDSDEDGKLELAKAFTKEALEICSNAKTLCSIVVDLCYCKVGTQQFAWDICGWEIFENLLSRNENKLHFPTRDPDGDIEYRGISYSMKEVASKYGTDYIEREEMG